MDQSVLLTSAIYPSLVIKHWLNIVVRLSACYATFPLDQIHVLVYTPASPTRFLIR